MTLILSIFGPSRVLHTTFGPVRSRSDFARGRAEQWCHYISRWGGICLTWQGLPSIVSTALSDRRIDGFSESAPRGHLKPGALRVMRLLVYTACGNGWFPVRIFSTDSGWLFVVRCLSTRQNSDPANFGLKPLRERDVVVSEPRNAVQRLHEFGVFVYSVCCHFHRAREDNELNSRARTAAAVPAVSMDPFSICRDNTISTSPTHTCSRAARQNFYPLVTSLFFILSLCRHVKCVRLTDR